MNENKNAKEHIVDVNDVEAANILETELNQPVKSLVWYKKGFHSRAALVETQDGTKTVARFGNVSLGYQKDRYAFEHFSSLEVPIPEIKLIKELNNDKWLCLSDYIDGITSDELHGKLAYDAIPNVQKTLVAIHSTPIDSIIGYGELDAYGKTNYSTWAEFLTDDFCSIDFYEDKTVDSDLLKHAWEQIGELSIMCPTQRYLVHDDFGSDNLLIKDNKVAANLDWYSSLIGDWAMDITRIEQYPREVYGDMKAYHEKNGFDCSNWQERMNCYRLRSQIGLINWFWDRETKGLENWQDLESAQQDLKVGLERVKQGLLYDSN